MEGQFVNRNEVRSNEKKESCSHTYLKCGCCNKCVDNLYNDYQNQIDILILVNDYYTELLEHNGIEFRPYKHMIESGILKIWKVEKIQQYIKRTKKVEDKFIQGYN